MNVKNKSEIELLNDVNKQRKKSSTIDSPSTILDFYETLALTIKSVSLQSKTKIKRIFIIGKNLKQIYSCINKAFPNAQYVFSDSSEIFLKEFIKEIDPNPSVRIKALDIFNGSLLTDFFLEFGKFDLIILSRIFTEYEIHNTKIRNSIRFLYKNFLNLNGMFSILENEKDGSIDLVNLLKRVKSFKKIIKSYQKKGISLQFVIYKKKNRMKLFGD